jgi:hypothetical protein
MTNTITSAQFAKLVGEARNQFKLAASEGHERPEGVALLMGNDAIVSGRTRDREVNAGREAIMFLSHIFGRELTFADELSPAQNVKAIVISTSVTDIKVELRKPTAETLAALRAYPGTAQGQEVTVTAANTDQSFKLAL